MIDSPGLPGPGDKASPVLAKEITFATEQLAIAAGDVRDLTVLAWRTGGSTGLVTTGAGNLVLTNNAFTGANGTLGNLTVTGGNLAVTNGTLTLNGGTVAGNGTVITNSTPAAAPSESVSDGSLRRASDSEPSRMTVAPALRAIVSIAVFWLSAWMNRVSTPRLRAWSIAC